MSEPNDPGPTHTPFGQDPYGQDPYARQPGPPQPFGDRRPGTVTAACWITIVLSSLSAILLGLVAVAFVVARDDFVRGFRDEWARSGAGSGVDIDAESIAGFIVVLFVGLAIWALIAVVLAVFTLRRSNVARILLVVSSSVVALLSLLGITSGVSILTLGAAVAVIVLLFVGGAGAWFKGPSNVAPPTGQYGYGSTSPTPYGAAPTNPYGQQPPSSDSGDGTGGGTGDYPPRDYPGR